MRRAAVACVLLSIILLMVASHSAASAQTPAATPASKTSPSAAQIEKEIAIIEQQDADALLRADIPALAHLWAPDLIVTASNNRIRTGTEVLGLVKSGQMRLTKLDRRVERIAVYGQVAVAMGEETFVPAGGEGAGKTFHRRYTDVFLQQDGRWQLIARQATLISTTP